MSRRLRCVDLIVGEEYMGVWEEMCDSISVLKESMVSYGGVEVRELIVVKILRRVGRDESSVIWRMVFVIVVFGDGVGSGCSERESSL